jgi:hypothetical protein
MRHGNHPATGDSCDIADQLQDQINDIVGGMHSHTHESREEWASL